MFIILLYYSMPYADLLSVIQPQVALQLVCSTSIHKVLIFISCFVAWCYKHPTSQPEYLFLRDPCTKGGMWHIAHARYTITSTSLQFQLPDFFPSSAFYCSAKTYVISKEKPSFFHSPAPPFSQNKDSTWKKFMQKVSFLCKPSHLIPFHRDCWYYKSHNKS